MKSVEEDKEYVLLHKNELEEKLYIELMILLSEIYRVGSDYEKHIVGKYNPYKNLFPNIDKAMRLLNSIKDNTIFDSNKTLLDCQLSRYKKKLFGGYKFV